MKSTTYYDNGYKKAFFSCDNCGNGGPFFWHDYSGFDIPSGKDSLGNRLVRNITTRPGLQLGVCAICGKKLGDKNVCSKSFWKCDEPMKGINYEGNP